MLLTLPACAYGSIWQTEAISPDEPAAYAAPAALSDVPEEAWYAEAVRYCMENGLMDGQ